MMIVQPHSYIISITVESCSLLGCVGVRLPTAAQQTWRQPKSGAELDFSHLRGLCRESSPDASMIVAVGPQRVPLKMNGKQCQFCCERRFKREKKPI